MADDAEKSVDSYEQFLSLALKQHASKEFDEGCPGDCELCGEPFSRVVKREYRGEEMLVCGGCRDDYKIG